MWWGSVENEGGRRGRSRHVDTTFGAALCSGSLRRLNGCPFVSLVSDSITHGRCKVSINIDASHALTLHLAGHRLIKVTKNINPSDEIVGGDRSTPAPAKLVYLVVMTLGYVGWLWPQTCNKEKVTWCKQTAMH
ncbi:hypothetical protein DAPPUDRAFT_98530 [Daphnia pulex]|uniref:Uncharacterized protein n=1 Tax=Daphnia pulex TaxID=6669 RepID=E9G3Z4_DAPPU|nr:hypothetical protein DAPPUDRAFT_98530 [Daphnia pulex]|eukprot:EFX85900.1 hypothetical protein DAPPUDRAFT_98530 [Daphnia pulex]